MVILSKKWIEQRKVTFDEETYILKIFNFGMWYRLKVNQQQPSFMVPSSLEEKKARRDHQNS